MKAITIWQPWAYMLMVGLKKYETRSWKTDYKGPLAIHAAAKADSEIKKIMDVNLYSYLNNELLLYKTKDLPRGCIIGTCELIGCHKIEYSFLKTVSDREIKFGNFNLGNYAWQIDNIEMFENPIFVKGQQRIWEWRTEDEKNIVQKL